MWSCEWCLYVEMKKENEKEKENGDDDTIGDVETYLSWKI